MKKITSEQIKVLKKSIENMAKSDEQFIFMIYKNKDGTDHIAQYSFNMTTEKVGHYFKEAVKTATFTGEKKHET